MASVSGFSSSIPSLSAHTDMGLDHLDRPTMVEASDPPMLSRRTSSHSARPIPLMDLLLTLFGFFILGYSSISS